MDGGNGNSTMIELLRRLVEGQDAFRQEVREGFAQVNDRLDSQLRFMGGYHADHEERIRALEGAVLKPSGT